MITRVQVLTLAFSQDGSPFCNVASGSINLNSLTYSKDGSPFWGHSGDSTPIITGNIKAIMKVRTPFIKELIGVNMTHIE
jgi:hypothetical protein